MDFYNETSQPLSEINIIPLVDVMLVLLILFMMTAPLLTFHLIKIDVPKVNHLADNTYHDNVVDLAMDEKGNIFWNDQRIHHQEFIQRLMTAAQKTPQPQLFLRAAKTLQYQKLTEVIVVIQRAGIAQVNFVTESAQ